MTLKNTILRIAVPTPLRRLFDYLPPQGVDIEHLKPGCRIQVPFQTRKLVGILIDVVKKSDVPVAKLKKAHAIIDNTALISNELMRLALWASEYYHYAVGEVLLSVLPKALRQGKTLPALPALVAPLASDLNLALSQEQTQAQQAIIASANTFNVFLLDGVTGSGKTEVYLQAIAHYLVQGMQALILVPEISLTPQTIARVAARFSVPVLAWHSNLSDKVRLHTWFAAANGDAKIIIGTRSAVFIPFKQLGIIIVDEEHDTSFKQQERFKYHGRDVAIMRSKFNAIPIVLGSATPSLESFMNAQNARYTHLNLSTRLGHAQMPHYQLLDMKKQVQVEGLSQALQENIAEHLAQNNQVLIFLNRRGFAPVFYCNECHTILQCERCDARLVYHRSPLRLQCHYCDSVVLVPKQCAQCQSESVCAVGVGTQRLESKLQVLFPDVPIIRLDRDNTKRKGAMQDLLTQMHQAEKAILIGTQMIAKGHHFKNVTLTAIIDVDVGLCSAEFKALEHTAQLILQVGGRAGREHKAGSVLIQTRNPEHKMLKLLLQQGYGHFARQLLCERQMAGLPPYTYCTLVRAESYQLSVMQDFLLKVKTLVSQAGFALQCLGPVTPMLAKKKGLHAQHLILQAQQRPVLQACLKQLVPQIEAIKFNGKFTIDVDPLEF
jgi:primosomal protein N' (replication factor Y)